MKNLELTRSKKIKKDLDYMERRKGCYACSYWKVGVRNYALMLLEDEREEPKEGFNAVGVDFPKQLKKLLLNGAKNWKEYSYGGCALCYDWEIAKTLCTPSELKKKKGGQLPPNSHETWLDVQARALYQAFLTVLHIYNSECNFIK